MKIICNIPFNVEGIYGYHANGYFNEDRNDRFLAIGIVDFIYNSEFSIETYQYLIDLVGRDILIKSVEEEYKKHRQNYINNISVQIILDLSEDEILYHKLKLENDFDNFFVLNID